MIMKGELIMNSLENNTLQSNTTEVVEILNIPIDGDTSVTANINDYCKCITTETVSSITDDSSSTCSRCVHCGICKHEDKLAELYRKVGRIVKDESFIEDIVILCKHFKSNNTITVPYDQTIPNVINPVPNQYPNKISTPSGYKDNFYYSTGTDSTNRTVEYAKPRFDTSAEVSKSTVDMYTDIIKKNNKIGSIGVTTDNGEPRSINTKVLGSSKKYNKTSISNTEVLDDTTSVNVIDTTVVPTKTIDPNDIPEKFRSMVFDNTGREEVPGTTTNV